MWLALVLDDWAGFLFVALWAATKFMVGIFSAILLQVGFFTGVGLCVASGMAGVLFFTYVWENVIRLYRCYFPPGAKSKSAHPHGPTFKTRVIEKVRAHFGLAGIALLTPLILTVPVGTYAALAITNQKRRIFLYMFLSFSGWSVLFFGLSYVFSEAIADLARYFVH